VLRALAARLPGEDFLYLGDTARLPYGTKTAATVERYALQAVEALLRRGVKAVVVACNTASSAALPALTAAHPSLPVIGVIEPGAGGGSGRDPEVVASPWIATEGTVRGGAYQREILRRLPKAQVTAVPATLFVALAEEGWTEGAVVESRGATLSRAAVRRCRYGARCPGARLHPLPALDRSNPHRGRGIRCASWILPRLLLLPSPVSLMDACSRRATRTAPAVSWSRMVRSASRVSDRSFSAAPSGPDAIERVDLQVAGRIGGHSTPLS